LADTQNPPAFPIPGDSFIHEGMTLRDYFAAAALTGLLANGNYSSPVKTAFETADVMLEQREVS
jgi:hypothetical protein